MFVDKGSSAAEESTTSGFENGRSRPAGSHDWPRQALEGNGNFPHQPRHPAAHNSPILDPTRMIFAGRERPLLKETFQDFPHGSKAALAE